MSEFKIVVCPTCEKENHVDADSVIEDSSCEFCHAPLQLKPDNQLTDVNAPAQVVDLQTLPYSAARPFWYVAVMMVATFGIYEYVWFYRTWKELLLRYQLKGSAVVNSIFSPLCIWSFFRYAFSFGETGGYKSKWQSNWAASLIFIITIIGNALSLAEYKIPDDEIIIKAILNFIVLSSLVFYLIPLREGVNAMNAGLSKVYPNNRIMTSFSAASIVFIIIGSILWLFVIFGFIITLVSLFIK